MMGRMLIRPGGCDDFSGASTLIRWSPLCQRLCGMRRERQEHRISRSCDLTAVPSMVQFAWMHCVFRYVCKQSIYVDKRRNAGTARRQFPRPLKQHELLQFWEVAVFRRSWEDLKLGTDDLLDLQMEIILNPIAGPLVQGTGGLRILRFSPETWATGKSGVRLRSLLHCILRKSAKVLLVLKFCAKSEKDELTGAEKSAARDLIARHQAGYAQRAKRSQVVREKEKKPAIMTAKNRVGTRIIEGLTDCRGGTESGGEPLESTVDRPHSGDRSGPDPLSSTDDVRATRPVTGCEARVSLLDFSAYRWVLFARGNKAEMFQVVQRSRILDEIRLNPVFWRSQFASVIKAAAIHSPSSAWPPR